MADVETKVNAIGIINGIRDKDISQSLRDAIATVVQDIPASDSMFKRTTVQEGAAIADHLKKAVKTITDIRNKRRVDTK